MKTQLSILAAAMLFISCEPQQPGNTSRVDSLNIVNDVRATHCEIFIDKVAIAESPDPETSGKVQDLYLFVKINPERLDAPIRGVSYFGEYTQSSMHGNDGGGNWFEKPLQNQDSATDYFRIKLKLVKLYTYAGSDQKEVFRHSGAFFVESEKGTRYWANAQNKDNFDFNMDFFKGGALNELRILTSFEPTTQSILNLKKTQELGKIGQFFNPQSCD